MATTTEPTTKIHQLTTLAQLEAELALLGYPVLTLTRRNTSCGASLYHHELGFSFGVGMSVWDAIEEVMGELRIKLGEKLKAETLKR